MLTKEFWEEWVTGVPFHIVFSLLCLVIGKMTGLIHSGVVFMIGYWVSQPVTFYLLSYKRRGI